MLGTRLDVAHVVAYLQANDHDASDVAQLLAIPEHLVHAAGYAAEFPVEIQEWLRAEADQARRAEPACLTG